LLSLVGNLYDGVLDENAWQGALSQLVDFVSGSGVALFSLDPSTGATFRADLCRVDPVAMQAYWDTWIHRDPRHAAALTSKVAVPYVDGMLIRMPEFRRTDIFNDFFLPEDVPYHLATWIERRPTRGVVLTVLGTRARGPFDEEERARMAALIPHLRRVVEIKDRLALAQTTAGALLETMDRLPFGLLLLGRDWEILESSAAAQALLARRAGIHAHGGRLGFLRTSDANAFAARLGEDPAHARLSDVLHVARPEGPPLALLVLPLKPRHEQWLTASARWLVLVFDATPAVPTERSLQQALCVTKAEAALAMRLAGGQSVAQAAEQLEVSVNTARAQLKSIFSKVGVNSQAQLVARIFSGPATISNEPPNGKR
jgi:DNA-binding CsgD family transcriptional regulator